MKEEYQKFDEDPELPGEIWDPPLWMVAFIDVHPVDGHEYGIAVEQFSHDHPTEWENIEFLRQQAQRSLDQYLAEHPEGDNEG